MCIRLRLVSLITLCLSGTLAFSTKSTTTMPSFLSSLLARNDVVYQVPTDRSEDGLPIGNGDVGTMVWTPSDEGGIAFQLNKVDAWSTDNNPHFYSSNALPSLARIVIKPSQPLQQSTTSFHQQLTLSQGLVDINATYARGACHTRTFLDATRPVMAVEISDTRPGAGAITATMSNWRIPIDNPRNSNVSMSIRQDSIILLQQYKTTSHYYRYAVALGGTEKTAQYSLDDVRTGYITQTPVKGKPAIVLAAVAGSTDPTVDVAEQAYGELTRARRAGLTALLKEHTDWWQRFWSRMRTYVQLDSNDGVAEYLEAMWYICLYQTASSSRGAFPPKFNGSIFLADRDFRGWGGNYWVWNTESMYFPLFAQNAMELVEPFYKMYWDELPAAKTAARQRWDKEGAFFIESTSFDGQEELTEEEVHNARLSNLGENPNFSYCSHILSSGSEIARIFWNRYAYTGDEAWLRDRAYPMMREVSLFYLDYFNKGEDGQYHIYPTNGHEAYWGIRDGIMDLAAVRWLFPRVIEASTKLQVDAELRSRCATMLEYLAPYPTAETPGAQELYPIPAGTFAPGLLGEVKGRQNGEAVRCTPVWPFEDIAVGVSADDQLTRARQTLPTEIFGSPDATAGLPGWTRTPIMAARLGMKDLTKQLLLRSAFFGRSYPSFPALDHELGVVRGEFAQIASTAIDEALLQSHHGLLQFFPAWPDDWNARFSLLAEGNVMVEAERSGGVVIFVSLQPRIGGAVTMLNPWPGQDITCQSGNKQQTLHGDKVTLATEKGESYLLTPVTSTLKTRPVIVIQPRQGEVKTFKYGQYTREMGLSPTDLLPKQPQLTLPIGPFTFTADADVASFVATNGTWHFGYNIPAQGRLSRSEKFGGALCISTHDGAPLLYTTYTSTPGKGASLDEVGNLWMEADFIPERTHQFGFFLRQNVLRTVGIYRVQLQFADNGKCDILFGIDEPGFEHVLRTIPTDLLYQDGKVYHLRITINNLTGYPVRYAQVKLEVFAGENLHTPLASGEYRYNLTADNMPDTGQAGIYTFQTPSTDAEKIQNLYIRNFIMQKPQ